MSAYFTLGQQYNKKHMLNHQSSYGEYFYRVLKEKCYKVQVMLRIGTQLNIVTSSHARVT